MTEFRDDDTDDHHAGAHNHGSDEKHGLAADFIDDQLQGSAKKGQRGLGLDASTNHGRDGADDENDTGDAGRQ